MFDYTNMNPIIQRGPDKTPLQLEIKETQFNPLPSGGLVSDAMFGPVRSIDPTTKFSPDAWAVRKQEEDTWGEVSDIELSLSGAGGNAESFGNVPGAFIEWATGVKIPKLFNDPTQGAVIKALYMNRSPLDTIKWGDSSLSEEAVKEAQTTLGLLWDKEPIGVAVDPKNLTENQKKMKEVMDYLIYAQARKRSYGNGNYSFADYFAAAGRDTPGILGPLGGPWNWVTEQIGKYYGSGTEMPKDMEDLNKVFSRKDPYFNYQEFWARAMENPIVQEGILDNGGSIDVIRGARNEDEANFLLNKALVNSHLQKRLAVYNANANALKKTFGGAVNLGVGMTVDPSTAPLTLATVGTGLLARGGVSILGHAGKAAAPLLGIKLTEGVLKTGRAIGMTTEALATLPLGGAPIYAHNLNVLGRFGFTVAGGSTVAGLHDIYIQNKQLAYAAAMEYSDPDAQLEFDSSRMFSSFGHGALAGSALFLGGATLMSLFGAAGNRAFGVKKTIEIPFSGSTLKVSVRNPLDRRLTLEGTTLGEIADTFGSIKGKIGTMFERTPAEKVQIDTLNEGTEPTAERLNTETNDQVNRSNARSRDTAEATNNSTEQSINKRLDNETRAQYARRMGLSKALTNPREFLSELGRKTSADIDANDAVGIDGTDMTNLSPTTRARVLIDAEQRIKEAQEAEVEANGGPLPADRLAFYNTLEKYRKSWLTNSLKQLTAVERKEFYKTIRGEPVEDRVNTARNTTIDNATRNEAADSVAAQLLEAARSPEKTVEIKDPVIKAAVEEARLENKVMGSISGDTAKYMVNIVRNGSSKTKSKIGKLIELSLKDMQTNKEAIRRIRSVVKDNKEFLVEAKGNKKNIAEFYDFVVGLEQFGLIDAQNKSILLLAALDYDFNSRTFTDIKYEIGDIASLFPEQEYDQVKNFAGLWMQETKTLVVDEVLAKNEGYDFVTSLVLHELGHAGVSNLFGTKSIVTMLDSYVKLTGSADITKGLFTNLLEKTDDPSFQFLSAYHLGNAEESLVETYAEFSYALNKEKFSQALNPLQRDYIRLSIDVALNRLVKLALGIDRSDYFTSIQPLINELQTMKASVKGPSINDVMQDLVALYENNDTSFKLSNLKLSKDEQRWVKTMQFKSELAAFGMLKAEGKSLFTKNFALTKEFKDFYNYLYLIREAELAAHTKQISSTIIDLVSSGKSQEEIKTAIKTLFTAPRLKRNKTAFYQMPENNFLYSLEEVLNNYASFDFDAKNGLTEAEFLELRSDSFNKLSIKEELTRIFYEHGLPLIAEQMDASFLTEVTWKLSKKTQERIEEDSLPLLELVAGERPQDSLIIIANRRKTTNYSKPAEMPNTSQALAAALGTVTEKEAKTIITKLIDIFDPVVLAMVARSSNQNEFAAIKLLEGFAKDGHLVYAPTIKKWTLKTQPTTVVEPVKAKLTADEEANLRLDQTIERIKDTEAKVKKSKPVTKVVKAVVEKPKPVLKTQPKVEANEDTAITTENLERTLTSFYDPSSADGRITRAFLTKVTKNKADIEDGITNTWIKFTQNSLPTIKEAIESGRLKTTADLRKYFVGSVKRAILDEKKKGNSTAGREALVKTVSKLETELQQAKEAGKDTGDIEDLLYAARFDLETFKTKSTTSYLVESKKAEGELVEVRGQTTTSMQVTAEMTAKEIEEFYGTWIYKVDKTIRSLLNLNDSMPVILTPDQLKLWRFISEQGVEKQDVIVAAKKGGERVKEVRSQLSDAELAKRSKEIFGREIKGNTIQEIRSGVFKTFEDIKARLSLTQEEVANSLSAITKDIDPDSVLIKRLKEELSKDITPVEQPKEVPFVPPVEAMAKSAETAAKVVADKVAMRAERKSKDTVVVPTKTVPETKEVVFSVQDETGNTAGTKLMTSEAADKVVEVRAESGETTTKTAVAVDKKDIVTVKTDGEVVTKPEAKTETVGSVTVKDPSGVASFTEKGVIVEKEIAPPVKETDPVITPRPYKNVPDSLMGFRKSGENKGFYQEKYPFVQWVELTFPWGKVIEAIKGLNKEHALERAYRNWSLDPESVKAIDKPPTDIKAELIITAEEPKVVKPEPAPVKDSPVVQELPHINFERLVNEHKDTLRANGSDVGFLSAFQKAYWKLMSKIDKAGKRTSATPLFKELFAQYVAINRAIQESNIKLLGQDKVDAFWMAVDKLRAEDARNSVTNPGHKKLTEKQLLTKAANSIHRQYLPPVMLDGDLKISMVDGKYKLLAKGGKAPKVIEPSPFPAEPKPTPKPKEAPAPTPEAPTAEAAPTPAAPVPQPPQQLPPVKVSIMNSIYSAGNKMSMPLRMSNFIGWIFGGSNRAERNWWQKSTSNLVNLIQHSSRLGDTARSNYVGIRVLAGLLDGTRNVTGMLVAPGKAPIMTLLGARGVEDRVLVRIATAQLEVMKRFGGNMTTINKFNTYLWTKIAQGQTITEAGLAKELGISPAAAKDILPSINQLIDADLRTKELYLRLGHETGMAVVHDINGNPYDPKTWMTVQIDHEKLRAIMQTPNAEAALINALVEARRKRKMGEELDVNTLIVLGWLDARAEGGDPRGSLMLRDRNFSEGFGVRKLTKETLDKLEIKGAVLGGANPSTIASIAKHGQPKDFFVIDVNGELRAYRVPRKRSDLSQADLLIYDQAVRGDTSMYLPKWQTALGNQELTRLEMIELLDHKLKRGRYMELKTSDRPLLKIQQREDVQLAIPALNPAEILSDSTGNIIGMIRTNLAEAHMYFLRGRLTEMLFQRELNKLFDRTDISIDEVFDIVKEIENRNLTDLAKKEKWSSSQEDAAVRSLERGLKRLKEEYRFNVETLPLVEQTTAGAFAEGTLTLARIFTAPGYWLSATPEVVGALAHHYPTEWPKAFGEALKFTIGKYRASKSGLLSSPIGDMSFILQNIRTDMANRYLGEQGRGAFTVDSTFDTMWNGPRSQWDNRPMQFVERGATLAEQVGSLSQITNIARYLSKIEMQRSIYSNIKNGRIQALINALKDPTTNKDMMDYLKASQDSAYAERKYWKKFAGIARANKFGHDPREALFFMRYGLNTPERIKHLQWAIEKVGDAEGRVDFLKLMQLAEDVRRKPVTDIDANILEEAINLYSHGIEAEILKRKTPEPYGLLKSTDIESRSAIGKVILALSGWMRAFHDGRIVDYSNKSLAGMMKFIAAYSAIDGFIQILKEALAGRDVSDIIDEMLDNPISIMQRVVHSIPLFGMFNGFFETAMSKFNTGSLFTPTMELSTPGIAVANSVVSRTDKGMSQAYRAMASGDLPEAAGYVSNILPVASFLNKSPLAVPVKIMESAVELDERNIVSRYMEVVRKDAEPYAKRRNRRSKTSTGFMLPAPERNLAKEQAQIAKAQQAMQKARAEVVPVESPMGMPQSVSTPLAELLKPQ